MSRYISPVNTGSDNNNIEPGSNMGFDFAESNSNSHNIEDQNNFPTTIVNRTLQHNTDANKATQKSNNINLPQGIGERLNIIA